MAHIVFYEKPGCIGNARQKKLLKRSGHELDVRDMTTTPWTPDLLRPFFGNRPVTQWFNLSSPRVTSGEVQTDALSADQALNTLCADPLLIRRPLLRVGSEHQVGFETDLIDAWIGLDGDEAEVGEGCPREANTRSSHTQDIERTSKWAVSAELCPAEIDCAIAVMLKILDGKCKMKADEKIIMTALYDSVKTRASQSLGTDDHDLITAARDASDETLREVIYERRVLAETVISRPVMKAYKKRLRVEGVLGGLQS